MVAHLRSLGWKIEDLTGSDGNKYIVIRNYTISSGSLAGQMCDVAFLAASAVPYVFPSAIHTKPKLVPMDNARYKVSQSGIGSDWQYWSRVLGRQPTPRNIVTHIVTIFHEV